MGGCESQMKDYKLSAQAIVMMSGSSAGTQPKYYDNGYWYKTNNNGYEGLSEYLVSLLLSCSNVDSYVTYEECKVNGRSGCRSKNFLNKSETYISFQRLYDMYKGGNLTEDIMLYNEVGDRINYVKDFIFEYTEYDITNYLSQILTLDYVTLNTDRHFHNLGIIANKDTGEFYAAPVFDNGDALLSNYEVFPLDYDIEENIERAYSEPFSSNHGIQAKEAGFGLKIDYDMLNSKLEKEPESRAIKVLKHQLILLKDILY